MKRRHLRGMVMALVAATSFACSGSTDSSVGDWVGTITGAGSVTTVVNESGSVWGGPVELVEDLSIGSELGDEAYLFGRIDTVSTTDDRIYVLDDQLETVRVYDRHGAHLFDFGGHGEGPGEFNNPTVMAVDPGGRVIVQDLRRTNIFDLDGNPLDTWPYRGGLLLPITVTADGVAFIPFNWREGGEFFAGLMAINPDGSEGVRVSGPDFDFGPWQLTAKRGGRTMITSVTYAPDDVWTVVPSGAIVEGIRDRYRFEVARPDGSKLIIERAVGPLRVKPREHEYLTAITAARMRAFQPDWAWTARPIPMTKPAYYAFLGDNYGRIWVQRIIRTDTPPNCEPDATVIDGRDSPSCWRDVLGFDVFDEQTGKFLGQVEQPADIRRRPPPAFLQDAILAVVEDDTGTVMVKRYRLGGPH